MGIAVGKPAKVKGTLKVVKKPNNRVSADEPDSIQGGSNPGAAPGQNTRNPHVKPGVEGDTHGALQKADNLGKLQTGNGNVNAGGGIKEAITRRVFGKKKAKGISLAQ